MKQLASLLNLVALMTITGFTSLFIGLFDPFQYSAEALIDEVSPAYKLVMLGILLIFISLVLLIAIISRLNQQHAHHWPKR